MTDLGVSSLCSFLRGLWWNRPWNPWRPFPDARSKWAYGCGKDTLNG